MKRPARRTPEAHRARLRQHWARQLVQAEIEWQLARRTWATIAELEQLAMGVGLCRRMLAIFSS